MIVANPLQAENGVISCPTCVTKPVLYLKHERTTLSYIEVPTIVRSLPQPKEESSLRETASVISFVFILVMIVNISLDVYFDRKKKHE